MVATDQSRFALGDDPRVTRWFSEVLVVCPNCGSPAVNRQMGDDMLDRRLTCSACGHSRDWQAKAYHWGDPVDPFSEARLWLVTDTSKGELFAYNAENLQALRDFVSAHLRERNTANNASSNSGYFARLPAWIKAKSNREMILAKLDKLAGKLEQAGKP